MAAPAISAPIFAGLLALTAISLAAWGWWPWPWPGAIQAMDPNYPYYGYGWNNPYGGYMPLGYSYQPIYVPPASGVIILILIFSLNLNEFKSLNLI